MSVSAAEQAERDALARLARVHGSRELRAALLALATQPQSEASLAAWRAETADLATAAALLADVTSLSDAARLPCLDALLGRMRRLVKAERRTLLQSTRRVMAACMPLRPIDRLHWLWMRRRLGDKAPVAAPPGTYNTIAELPAESLLQIARMSAYLTRIVPSGDAAAGRAWYADALARVMPPASVPACEPPDGDGFAHAVDDVVSLPWMLRPVLVRAFVDAALATSGRARLAAPAADGLRLAACLLDSPLPPDLSRHYIDLREDTR